MSFYTLHINKTAVESLDKEQTNLNAYVECLQHEKMRHDSLEDLSDQIDDESPLFPYLLDILASISGEFKSFDEMVKSCHIPAYDSNRNSSKRLTNAVKKRIP